jgi:hypothetical protein
MSRRTRIERSGGGVVQFGPGSYGAFWRGRRLAICPTLAEARERLWNAPGGIVDELMDRQAELMTQRWAIRRARLALIAAGVSDEEAGGTP